MDHPEGSEVNKATEDEEPSSSVGFGPAETPTEKPICGRRKSLWDRLCLFRKHSSGDLHSRLKTRKLLGVGETDDGEIHRSKISQLLGHNEHLFLKFPRGFWPATQAQVAAIFVQGLLFVFIPQKAAEYGLFPGAAVVAEGCTGCSSSLRLAGVAMTCLAYGLHQGMRTFEFDKVQGRSCLVAIILFNSLTAASSLWASASSGILFTKRSIFSAGARIILALTSGAYLQALNSTNSHNSAAIRRGSSTFSREPTSSPIVKCAPDVEELRQTEANKKSA
ncbi:unnamed protein product [Notodromas monacha]|uniref:Tumor protein p53-inducible protein 11 n=1 Tax=Notodromas monacha TaxID=399045 RepID=A0A7R9BR46_9CRUS|nr:unnamed protein product [Notodromas monacha]CAG0918628.1 unnamed protein product [Notodromas monacha]